MAIAVITEKGRISFETLSENGRDRIGFLLEIGERVLGTSNINNVYRFDQITVSETFNAEVVGVGIIVSDSISVSDSSSFGFAVISFDVGDSISIAETCILEQDFIYFNVGDDILVTEIRVLDYSIALAVSDVITPFEFSDVVMDSLPVVVFDGVSISEFAGGLQNPSGLIPVDIISILENTQVFMDVWFALVGEVLTVSDSSEQSIDVLVPDVGENIPISEVYDLFDIMDLFEEDDLAIVENFEFVVAWLVTPVEDIIVTESVAFYRYGVPQRVRCVPTRSVGATLYTREGVCV